MEPHASSRAACQLHVACCLLLYVFATFSVSGMMNFKPKWLGLPVEMQRHTDLLISNLTSLHCVPWASAVGYRGEVNHTVWVVAHTARLTGYTRAYRCLPMYQPRRVAEQK